MWVDAAIRQPARARTAPVLRRCACGGVVGPGGECAACSQKRLQRQAQGAGPELAPPVVHEVLRSLGRPLEPPVRAAMEARLGHDFSHVRVHADTRAAESARAVNALAYTVGRDIVFDRGRYAPTTGEGLRLLSHELAHVRQQLPRGVSDLTGLRVAAGCDQHETEAAAASPDIATRPSKLARFSRPVLQRQQPEGKSKPPLIPIPVFDELDPMVTVPDVPGVPSFLRGQDVKLSTLRKALDVLRGDVPSLGGGAGGDDCSFMLPGFEKVTSGPLTGLCCPKFNRDRNRCCRLRDIGMLDFRCCGPDEVVIQGRCVRPPRAPTPSVPPIPAPAPAPGPTPAPAPAPKTKLPSAPPFPALRFPTIQSDTIDHFDPDSSTIPPGASDKLDQLAALTKLHPDALVHVDGHTDSTNTPAYNKPLSDRRAGAVRDALIARGVDGSRLVVKGHGEGQLLFRPEKNDEEKARNRRVEVWLLIPSAGSLGGVLRLPTPMSSSAGGEH